MRSNTCNLFPQWFDSSTPPSLCPPSHRDSVGCLPSSRSFRTAVTSTTSPSSCFSSCTPVRAATTFKKKRGGYNSSLGVDVSLITVWYDAVDFRSSCWHLARTPWSFPRPVPQVGHTASGPVSGLREWRESLPPEEVCNITLPHPLITSVCNNANQGFPSAALCAIPAGVADPFTSE